MSIRSRQIVTAPRKSGIVHREQPGTSSLESQLEKRIKSAERRGQRWVEAQGELVVKRDDGVWCLWSEPGWWKVTVSQGH